MLSTQPDTSLAVHHVAILGDLDLVGPAVPLPHEMGTGRQDWCCSIRRSLAAGNRSQRPDIGCRHSAKQPALDLVGKCLPHEHGRQVSRRLATEPGLPEIKAPCPVQHSEPRQFLRDQLLLAIDRAGHQAAGSIDCG